MQKLIKWVLMGGVMLAFLFWGCKKDDEKGCNLNLFTINRDISLGQGLEAEIASRPGEYPLLSRATNAQAYAYLDAMTNDILNSGEVRYRNQFEWKVSIINDDVLNAFCAPGGYIYVYTGLIKFLERGSDLAGVMGHEIAHADLRHSTCQMTQQYGIQTLVSVALGDNPGLMADIAVGLIALQYSRNDESQADAASVRYLCNTRWDAAGAAGFFQKLIDGGQAGRTPEFLSTHPSPDNRVPAIRNRKAELGCTGNGPTDDFTAYAAFKNTLP